VVGTREEFNLGSHARLDKNALIELVILQGCFIGFSCYISIEMSDKIRYSQEPRKGSFSLSSERAKRMLKHFTIGLVGSVRLQLKTTLFICEMLYFIFEKVKNLKKIVFVSIHIFTADKWACVVEDREKELTFAVKRA
jgi:hypothetical protein